jgi:hypothetical protein
MRTKATAEKLQGAGFRRRKARCKTVPAPVPLDLRKTKMALLLEASLRKDGREKASVQRARDRLVAVEEELRLARKLTRALWKYRMKAREELMRLQDEELGAP